MTQISKHKPVRDRSRSPLALSQRSLPKPLRAPGKSKEQATHSWSSSHDLDNPLQLQELIPFYERGFTKLEQLTVDMRLLNRKIDRLESKFQSETPANVNDVMPSLPENFKFPLDDVEQLNCLDNTLTDLSVKQKMVLYLSNYGGKNAKDALKRILKEILAPCLSVKYSMEGKKGKLKFNDLRNIKLTIFESVMSQHPCTIKDLERNTGSWLALSADRDGGRKRRNESSRSSQINTNL